MNASLRRRGRATDFLFEPGRNDEDIVGEIRKGNAGIEDAFMRYYRPLIIRELRGMTDPIRAEDLAHDTLIIVLCHLREGRLRTAGALRSYVLRTARYVFIGHIRRPINTACSFDRELIEDDTIPSLGETDAQLLDAIRQLSRLRDQDLLRRRFVYEQTKPEICAALELRPDEYDRLSHRARQRLRKVIERPDALPRIA